MLRLQPFTLHRPATLDEAIATLGELHAAGASVKLLAGGTDLLPNMKHEITTPGHVVLLPRRACDTINVTGDRLTIGAMATLEQVATSLEVRGWLPALAEACRAISGPQLRRMGTLGGNVCLDTRCLYVNQSHFWRSALGYCHKRDGDVCHVVKGGRNCVAAASNDAVLPLLLSGAELCCASVRGERTIGIADFYVQDGVCNKRLAPDEVLKAIAVPRPRPRTRIAFEKLRLRKSIDFSLANLQVSSKPMKRAWLRVVRSCLAVSMRGPSTCRSAMGSWERDSMAWLSARLKNKW